MTDTFPTTPAIAFHPPDPVDDVEPAEDAPEGDEERGRTVVIGEHLWATLVDWVTTHPFIADPQPPWSLLTEHALSGDWTTSTARRRLELGWLCVVALPGRIVAWLPLQLWLRKDARIHPLRDELPELGELVSHAREHGGQSWVWIGPVVVTGGASRVLDSPAFTAAAVGLGGFAATAANEVPVLRAVTPDWLTARFWWEWSYNLALVIGEWLQRWGPDIAKGAGVLLLVLAVLAIAVKATSGDPPQRGKGIPRIEDDEDGEEVTHHG